MYSNTVHSSTSTVAYLKIRSSCFCPTIPLHCYFLVEAFGHRFGIFEEHKRRRIVKKGCKWISEPTRHAWRFLQQHERACCGEMSMLTSVLKQEKTLPSFLLLVSDKTIGLFCCF